MLKARRGVGDVGAANVCAPQFTIGTNEDVETDARLDVGDAGYRGNLFDTGVVENARGCFVRTAIVATFAFRST